MKVDVFCTHCGSVEPHNSMNTAEGAWRYCWTCRCIWDPSDRLVEAGGACLPGLDESAEEAERRVPARPRLFAVWRVLTRKLTRG